VINTLFKTISSPSDCIRCFSGTEIENILKPGPVPVELFYSETKSLKPYYSQLKNYINSDERLRADKFHFISDRETFITCHALLRLILAKRLNTTPLNISFTKGLNNKPCLQGNQLFFNIAHTRDEYAIAVSGDFHVGIDLEKINQSIDIQSIIGTYFSRKEHDFIFKSKKGARDRFFLLWTRKEALLKALGTGIINNLTSIEVSEQENFIDLKSFDNLVLDAAFNELFIYSKKLWNYYLSIAIPYKVSVVFYHLNRESTCYYLD
jgi:4'-phosphopantetheinyl transferase